VTQLLEMVNSLLLSTTVFLRVLYSQFCYETEEVIANYLLTTAASTLVSKVSEESVKTEYYTLFFDKILERVGSSLDFEDSLLNFVYTADQIGQTVQWLDGESPINLTQARRWRLLKQYSRISIDAKAQVDLEADFSLEGKLARLYCEAVYPDPEVKARAWEMFMTGCPELSRYERKSAMSGFLRKSQKTLLNQYSKKYFDSIPAIKQKFDPEYLVDFCSLLFPEFRKLEYLKKKVEKTLNAIGNDNKQIVKIFMDKLEVIERNRKIKKASD